MKLLPTKNFDLPTKDMGSYKMPMAAEYVPAWRQVLVGCVMPRTVVVLDFESYFDSEYSMKKMSTVEYIKDSRFEVMGLAQLTVHEDVRFPDYEHDTGFHIGEEGAKELLNRLQREYGKDLRDCVVVCHNGPFDAQVLALRFGIHPRHVIDTLGLARAWNSRTKNDLGALAKRLELEEKGETAQFDGLSFRVRYKKPKGRGKAKLPVAQPKITDEQLAALMQYACNDVKREWEIFTMLLPRLSEPKTELRIFQHTLELFTKPCLKVDFDKGTELAKLMDAEIDKVMGEVGHTREDISGDLSFARLIDEAIHAAGDLAQKYYKIGKRGYILAIAKTDSQRELLVKHSSPRVRQLMAARIALDSWPNHIKRINRIMSMARAVGGFLPVPLKYHGAHTGRWSGGEKINLQNLGSRGHDLVNAVRELIVAVENYSLAVVDASQIEARVLAWIAGQWDLVEKFAKGQEIYCDFASKVLGYPVRKPKKNGIPVIESKMKWARNAIGKIGILGCGYGMGTDRIFDYAQGEIDIETADKIKITYRTENAAIVQFWKDVERAFLYTAKYKRSCEMPRGLRFDSSEHCDVIITLPSGREIHYVSVRVKPGERGDTLEVWNDQEKHWAYIWGGTITENIVQAIARDVLAGCILRLEDRGYHIAFHCHDEVVMHIPDEHAEAALKAGNEEMSRRPTWGAELPLGSEGLIAKRYGGH